MEWSYTATDAIDLPGILIRCMEASCTNALLVRLCQILHFSDDHPIAGGAQLARPAMLLDGQSSLRPMTPSCKTIKKHAIIPLMHDIVMPSI